MLISTPVASDSPIQEMSIEVLSELSTADPASGSGIRLAAIGTFATVATIHSEYVLLPLVVLDERSRST